MVLMDSFYKTNFYPTTSILCSFSTHHIPSCFGSRVDMVSNLDPVSIIFVLPFQ
jgi:hypothetical protein